MIKILDSNIENYDGNRQGANIILTHSDVDGLVSAAIAREFITSVADQDRCLVSDRYIIVSSLAAQPIETDKMLKVACKYLGTTTEKLTANDMIWILDRTNFTDEMISKIGDINNIPYMVVADHHISSTLRHEEVLGSGCFRHMYSVLSNDINSCGATNTKELVYELLRRYGFSSESYDAWKFSGGGLDRLVEITNNWDTFRWKTLDDESEKLRAQKIQSMDKIFGDKVTWDIISKAVSYSDENNSAWDMIIDDVDLAYKIFESKLNDHKFVVKHKCKNNLVYGTRNGVKSTICIMFGMEEFQSMLSDYIFEENSDIDAVIWINYGGTISVRSREGSSIEARELAVKLSEASGFTGGGHPKAAGGRIKGGDIIREELVDEIYKGMVSSIFDNVYLDIEAIVK